WWRSAARASPSSADRHSRSEGGRLHLAAGSEGRIVACGRRISRRRGSSDDADRRGSARRSGRLTASGPSRNPADRGLHAGSPRCSDPDGPLLAAALRALSATLSAPTLPLPGLALPSTALPAPAPAGPTGPLALPGAAGLHAGGRVGGGTSRHVRRRLGRIRQCGGGVGTGRE